MSEMEPDFQPCAFCRRIAVGHFLLEGAQTVVFRDAYPLTRGHVHITPRRHYESFFDVPENERLDMISTLWEAHDWAEERYWPTGYNIGINVGQAAGQSIPHANIHLIPRYGENLPRGSRWVLGGKGSRKNHPSLKEILSAPPLFTNGFAYLFDHPNPATPGQGLVMLRRKKPFWDMTREERESFWDLIYLSPRFLHPPTAPDGYNVALDIGPSAGGEGDWVLAHIMPRWNRDTPRPYGVRWMAGENPDYRARGLES